MATHTQKRAEHITSISPQPTSILTLTSLAVTNVLQNTNDGNIEQISSSFCQKASISVATRLSRNKIIIRGCRVVMRTSFEEIHQLLIKFKTPLSKIYRFSLCVFFKRKKRTFIFIKQKLKI